MNLAGQGIIASIALLLVVGAILYLKRMQNVTEKDILRRVRAEYSLESQKQVLEFYRHLKTKELEGLFSKILDDSKGDINKVKKLTNVAENVGWKAFLENDW